MGTIPRTPEEYRVWWEANTDVPFGYCWCACGQKTKLAKGSSKRDRQVKGQPVRFIHGHNGRCPALTGKTFGRWTVLGEAPNWSGNPRVYCVCSCGTQKSVAVGTLKNGRSKSCGCLRAELLSARMTTHGFTSAANRAPEYKIWGEMIQRCHNPKNAAARNYSERGITVCASWRDSFENFYADMGPRPTPKHSIDRIDNNGDYEPENCRWATAKEQMRNTRTTLTLTHKGETLPLKEWAERTGIPYNTLRFRLRRGWSILRALTEPVQQRRKPS